MTSLRFLLICFYCVLGIGATAQGHSTSKEIGRLRQELENKTEYDTSRVHLLFKLSQQYFFMRYDSTMLFNKEALLLSRRLNYSVGEIIALQGLSLDYGVSGDEVKSYDYAKQALTLAEKVSPESVTSSSMISNLSHDGLVGIVLTAYAATLFERDAEQALMHFRRALRLNKQDFPSFISLNEAQIAYCLIKLNQADSALIYAKQAFESMNRNQVPTPFVPITLGKAYFTTGDVEKAREFFRLGAKISSGRRHRVNVCESYIQLSQTYYTNQSSDSALHYSKLAMIEAQKLKSFGILAEAAKNMFEIYLHYAYRDEALKFANLRNAYRDSLRIQVRDQALADLEGFDLALKNFETEKTESEYQKKIMWFVLITGFILAGFVIIIIFRENRLQKQSKQKIESAYNQLQSTQSQLIQSEKMASLGELTAGIAHEIQNPLNFVNNFSEVNTELIRDLKSEIQKGNIKEVATIANDIESNEGKIVHHGKRADGIVKSMLQHSRTSSGQKELTDINALCDEYLRLSYHGYRAKDKSFNAKFETMFDSSLPKVNVVPQDIGRVVLNLINNAFYATNEKAKLEPAASGFQPLISVATKNLGNKIEVRVKDNGNGIPDRIKEKIFEPFFTTKPTGQGTGLGLSLSYDIVKAHRGAITVESKEGNGCDFTIQIALE